MSTAVLEFEEFCAFQACRVRRQLNHQVERVRRRQAAVRKAQVQALADYDLAQQPFKWTSAMGPRARNLSEVEGDE